MAMDSENVEGSAGVLERSAAERGPGHETQEKVAAPAGVVELSLLMPQVEAVIVTSGRPVPAGRLAAALGLVDATEVEGASGSVEGSAQGAQVAKPEVKVKGRKRKVGGGKAGGLADALGLIEQSVKGLNRSYEASGRSFRIELVSGGYRLMTLAAHRQAVAAYSNIASSQRLSKAGIETLAIIAYKQPITRAKLEAIRGVACGEVLRSLMDRRLVTIAGRAEELGRPMLYGTTRQFLEAFGLATIKDLPNPADFATLPRRASATTEVPKPAVE